MFIDKSGLACCLYCTKVVGAVLAVFPRRFSVKLHNPPANGKQRPIPEEMSQILLINKKQGNLD
jgi:hypothetical protein